MPNPAGIPDAAYRAIKDYAGAKVAPRPVFEIEGRDYSDRLGAHSWGWEDGGPAKDLKATVKGLLPIALQNATVRLAYDVAGHETEEIASAEMRLRHDARANTTEIDAVTAGGLADRADLKENLELGGWEPRMVVWRALRKLPYPPHLIRVAPLTSPAIERTAPAPGDEQDFSFDESETARDMVDAVAEESPMLWYDTARGTRVRPDPGLGIGAPTLWEYDAGTAEVLDFPTPELLPPDETYTRVCVLDKNQDGTDRVRVERGVYYPNLYHRPPTPRTLYLPFSDR